MKGFLSDHGARKLKEILNYGGPHSHLVLPLLISIHAGWNYKGPGTVQRMHEADKLMREVAYEVLTGRCYWRKDRLPVEKLFECQTFEELMKTAETLTNGYIRSNNG